ncbi:hypothetical protein SBY92_001893 [Candida maltosa Xu316]|uniref:Alpha-1,6-mannanase n=1 Tax=Candida maltosa (strain Xu316) TaxID=1245528 RepID=M3JCY9_CANMX|nr:hypothetical protein G210_4956 [Candida maltosa Xu316]
MNPVIVLLLLSFSLAVPVNTIVRTVVVTAPAQIVTVSQPAVAPTLTVGGETSQTSEVTSDSSDPASSSSTEPESIATAVLSSKSETGNFYYDTVFKLWQRFWIANQGKWNDDDTICNDGDFDLPVLWNMAVLGKAIANTNDVSGVKVTAERIMDYRDADTGVFSASPNSPSEIYTDDNAQLAWFFIDAYKLTNNQQYLNSAQDIMSFLQSQWGPNGGVIWKKDQNYIASISTVEAALTAVRLYEITNDNSLIDFANKCMDFMFKNLQDPSDNLFYDGTNKNDLTQIDKGKLTYTVGCAISTLTSLHKFNNNDSDSLDKALQLAKAATNTTGAFYTDDGLWNNNLEYVHLLFIGFLDAFQASSKFDQFKDEVVRQGNYIYEYLQDPNDPALYFESITQSNGPAYERFSKVFSAQNYTPQNSIFCSNDPSKPAKKSLLVNASAGQILYAMANF